MPSFAFYRPMYSTWNINTQIMFLFERIVLFGPRVTKNQKIKFINTVQKVFITQRFFSPSTFPDKIGSSCSSASSYSSPLASVLDSYSLLFMKSLSRTSTAFRVFAFNITGINSLRFSCTSGGGGGGVDRKHQRGYFLDSTHWLYFSRSFLSRFP